MSYKNLVKKLEIERKLEKPEGIITSKEIKKFCKNKSINLDYGMAIGYLLNNNYLERILRGIFYIRTLEEKKKSISKINFIDAIIESMKIKGVNNWYFGLETALKMNNLTHETFFVDTIINDKIKNSKPLEVLGHKVKFTKIKGVDYSFGIKKAKTKSEKEYFYSDPERTLLDIAYLEKYRGKSNESIRYKIVDYKTNNLTLKDHSKNYPKTVKEIFEK